MPISRTEETLLKIDALANRDFVSVFPLETAMSSIYGVLNEDFGKTSMANIHKLSKIAYGKILWKWGAPSKDIAVFGDFLDGFKQYSATDFAEAWEAIKNGDALEIADEILDLVGPVWESVGTIWKDTGEAIPIVNIFVQLANVGVNAVKDIRKVYGSIDYPIKDVAMEYTRGNDEEMVRYVLRQLEEEDWTKIFAPPVFRVSGDHDDARASGIAHSGVKWKSGKGQGAILTVQGGPGIPELITTGVGFHPQTTRIPIAWQYWTGDPKKPKDRRKWTYKRGLKNRVDSFEEFHPASQQLSVLLWQRVLKNGPEIYRIDAIDIRGGWSSYFKVMEEYLTRKSDELGTGKSPRYVRPITRGVIERVLSPEYWGNGDAIKQIGGIATGEGLLIKWKVLGKEVPLSYYTDPSKMLQKGLYAGEYYDWKWRQSEKAGTAGVDIAAGKDMLYGLSGPRLTAKGLTQFIIDETLKKRQLKYLDTLTIAYLTPDMPAFRKWPELKDKFLKNREILLSHDARIWVDMDRVPEGGWKNKLKDSLKGIPQGMKYTLMGGKIRAAVERGDSVVPVRKATRPGNALTLIPAVGSPTKPSGGGGGGGGVAIAAAAALGIVVMSGKKK